MQNYNSFDNRIYKIDIAKNESKAKNFSFASNFLLSILALGTSNEGTPV